MTELPIACSLSREAFQARMTQLGAGVLASAAHHEPLPNGHRWRFQSTRNTIARLGPLIDSERQCCRFLRFDLHAAADLGEVVLDVTGPEGTVEFLSSWLPPSA